MAILGLFEGLFEHNAGVTGVEGWRDLGGRDIVSRVDPGGSL